MSRLRPAPAALYIRPKAGALVDQERDHIGLNVLAVGRKLGGGVE